MWHRCNADKSPTVAVAGLRGTYRHPLGRHTGARNRVRSAPTLSSTLARSCRKLVCYRRRGICLARLDSLQPAFLPGMTCRAHSRPGLLLLDGHLGTNKGQWAHEGYSLRKLKMLYPDYRHWPADCPAWQVLWSSTRVKVEADYIQPVLVAEPQVARLYGLLPTVQICVSGFSINESTGELSIRPGEDCSSYLAIAAAAPT